MQGIYNWLLDFCFYGFLDSIVMYLFIIKLFLNNKINFKNMILYCLIISSGISIITSLVPIFGLSQILMGIYIGICIFIFHKINILKSIFYGILSVIFLFLIETSFALSLNNINQFNILGCKLNSLCRLFSFIIFKFIEIIIIWGFIK